jgi:acetolactate synthase-1/2/3 large subunit
VPDLRTLCDALEAQGVDRIFGLPGTQTVELFEALRTSRIRVVLATSENAAAFMANGYFRAIGKPGVVLTIGGPGFTWALPGIAEARLDSAAVVHLATAPATAPGRAFQLQRIDQEAVAGPLVKGVWGLGPDDDPARVVGAAFDTATTGEPGPVLVQLARTGGGGEVPGEGDGRGADEGLEPPRRRGPSSGGGDPGALEEAVRRVRGARRLVLLVGQGTLDAAGFLRALVERDRIPVLTTPSARGVVSEDHPLCMPFDVLRGGVAAANELLEEADLVVALGCKLGHNGSAGFQLRLPEDRFVHVDREPAVLGANYPTSLPVVADAGSFLRAVLEEGDGGGAAWDQARLASLRERLLTAPDAPEPVIHGRSRLTPATFFQRLRDALPDDAILVTDTGLHQILTRRHFRVHTPRGLLMPSDFQSMGFGLPAALGAVAAGTGRPVVALVGDGSFLMTGTELVTAVRDGLSLPVIVFNDGRLNQIRLDQLGRFGRESAVELGSLDLATFAEAVGVEHVRFDELAEGGLASLLRRPGPVIVEVGVGDSWSVRASATRARAKGMARAALGPRVLGWIKGRS